MHAVFKCPRGHKHEETTTCYNHHKCRCTSCSSTRARYERTRRHYKGVDGFVPSGPTSRRLRALACIGWSSKKVAAELDGFTGSTIALIREGNQSEVKRSTALQVGTLYDRLQAAPNTGSGSKQTRGWANKYGWLAPLDWADIERGAIEV